MWLRKQNATLCHAYNRKTWDMYILSWLWMSSIYVVICLSFLCLQATLWKRSQSLRESYCLHYWCPKAGLVPEWRESILTGLCQGLFKAKHSHWVNLRVISPEREKQNAYEHEEKTDIWHLERRLLLWQATFSDNWMQKKPGEFQFKMAT